MISENDWNEFVSMVRYWKDVTEGQIVKCILTNTLISERIAMDLKEY